MKKTAIILVTKDRENLLKQTINSLFKNTPRDMFDLIVVDDGSDSTSYLERLHKKGDISDLILTNFGSPAKCRNLGAEVARKKGYEFLYHTDNDMYFLKGWLEKCHELKKLPHNFVIIGPYCHPFLQKNDDIHLLMELDWHTVDAVSGNSWFISTKDYFKYGLKETDGIMASEDWEMCQRIRKDTKNKSVVIRTVPHLVLHCGVTNSNGEASVGADMMIEELSKARIKHNLTILYE